MQDFNNPITSHQAWARFLDALATYASRDPIHIEQAEAFATLSLARDGADPYKRQRLAAHFTGSAWLVSADGQRALLTHHRKLNRWLQLGGHADGDRDLAQVALREAQEESGLSGLTVDQEIFDLDRHWIADHEDVPGHWHYDVRYVVRASADEAFRVSHESHALAWRPVVELLQASDCDASMRRMARKWLGRG